jgi:flagellar FliL protein
MSSAATNPALPPPDGVGRKPIKKLVIGALAALLLLGGAAAVAWFLGIIGGVTEGNVANREEARQANTPVTVLIDLPEVTTTIRPEVTTTLQTTGRRAVYIRLRAQLELRGTEGTEHLQRLMPRVIDIVHTHLREMRREEIHNEQAMERLRHEMTERINIAIAPHKVERFIFREVMMQ